MHTGRLGRTSSCTQHVWPPPQGFSVFWLFSWSWHNSVCCLSPWIVHRWLWLFYIVRCLSKNSRNDVLACVCTYVGLHMVLNVIVMCMRVCEFACGAYRIPGVAWNRFLRRVGSGYAIWRNWGCWENRRAFFHLVCVVMVGTRLCSRDLFRILSVLGLGWLLCPRPTPVLT